MTTRVSCWRVFFGISSICWYLRVSGKCKEFSKCDSFPIFVKNQWSISDPVFAGLGKKKSKVCCQYKKPRADLDESSDSDSDCPGH